MEEKRITNKLIAAWKAWLEEDEKSEATVAKYLHDVKVFWEFCGDGNVEKVLALAYKQYLEERYSLVSANSMIAALNSFLHFAGWQEMRLKQFKVQRSTFVPEEKELSRGEYMRLVKEAQKRGKDQLQLILQTICATGMRVSELKWITAESVRRGQALVSCKKKSRTVFLVSELQNKLLAYIKKEGIATGPVFLTKKRKPISRGCIWREMKGLCQRAGVPPSKVFPHNLRHLFARTFYGLEKDIVKLADLLGHSNINTTRIYTITTSRAHRRSMEGLRLIL